jgi:hypothetical protein
VISVASRLADCCRTLARKSVIMLIAPFDSKILLNYERYNSKLLKSDPGWLTWKKV